MAFRIVAGILIGAGVGSVTGYFGKCSSGTCPLTATPFRGAVYGGVIGLLFAAVLTAPGRSGSSPGRGASAVRPVAKSEPGRPVAATSPDRPEAQKSPYHVRGKADFDARILKADVPCLVDFYSDYCPPCRVLGPTIEKLAERYEGRAFICKVNVDGGRNADVARRYGIRGIPAVLFFDGGKEVERYVGLREEGAYVDVLDGLLPNQAPREKAAGPARETPRLDTAR